MYLITILLIIGFLIIIPQLQKVNRKNNSIKKEIDQFLASSFVDEIPGITHFRSNAYIATAVLILAIDFPICPRRFAKTENFGSGLMDIGVGSFVFSNGIVSPQATGKFKIEKYIINKFQ